MKKFFLYFYTFTLFYFFIAAPPASANCCTGRGCNSANLPPYRCAPYYCDTQPECDAKAPAPAAGPAPPPCPVAGGTGTPTALGCIPNEPAAAIKLILPWAIKLGTGLAFLLFLYGASTLTPAGSDPQKVDTGKSIITSATAGLIFIILSMLLLRVIGVDILKL